MSGPVPEEHVRLPLVSQRWRDVAFVHWRVAPDVVRPHLGPGLEPDLVDGDAWITLTPFRVEGAHAGGVPLPFGGGFCETNLRTYVRDRDGVDGLWFLSLDVSNVANALGGRAILPYHLAEMSVEAGDRIRYWCRRRSGPDAHHDLEVEPLPAAPHGEEAAVGTALAGRWRAFVGRGPRTLATVAVEHRPWPLQQARLMSLDESLLRAAGLPAPTCEPLVHYARGVDARLGSPRWRRA